MKRARILLAFCARTTFLRILLFSFSFFLLLLANEALKAKSGDDPFCKDYPYQLSCKVIFFEDYTFNIADAPNGYAVCSTTGTE